MKLRKLSGKEAILIACVIAILGFIHHVAYRAIVLGVPLPVPQIVKSIPFPQLPVGMWLYFLLLQVVIITFVVQKLFFASRCRCPLCSPPSCPKYKVVRVMHQSNEQNNRLLLVEKQTKSNNSSKGRSEGNNNNNENNDSSSEWSLLRWIRWVGKVEKREEEEHQHRKDGSFSNVDNSRERRKSEELLLLGGGGENLDSDRDYFVLKEAKIEDITECSDAFVEMELLFRVEHPHLVKIQDQFFHRQRRGFAADIFFCIVEEYVSAGDLFDYIDRAHKERGGLSEKECLEMFVQIVEAVEFMHSKNVLHRDLKPDNILVAANGCVKVSDLGLGEKLRSKVGEGGYAGTNGFISPEVFEEKKYGKACDIWSLGIVLFTMICWIDILSLFKNAGLATESDRDCIEVIIRSPKPAIDLLLKKVNSYPSIRRLLEMMLLVNPKQRANCTQLLRTDILRPFRKPSRRRSRQFGPSGERNGNDDDNDNDNNHQDGNRSPTSSGSSSISKRSTGGHNKLHIKI